MTIKNLYKILQVDPTAEPEIITAAYKRLALKYHPDVNASRDSTVRMQEINEAYQTLNDPNKRQIYDRLRKSEVRPAEANSEKRRARKKATSNSKSQSTSKNAEQTPKAEADITPAIIQKLENVPGILKAHPRDLEWATIYLSFKNGCTIRTWRNPLGIEHVFVVSKAGKCLFGGFVWWAHSENLEYALFQIEREFEQYHS